MKLHERKLIELQDVANKIGGGLEILYSSHNPTIIDDIPHHWCCVTGQRGGKLYTGRGVTMEQAVCNCWNAWYEE